MMLDNFMLYLIGGVFGIMALVWCATLTPAARMVVAAFLAVPQFYLPGLPVTVADAWVAMMALFALIDKRVRLVHHWATLPAFGLVVVYFLAQLWSVTPFSQTNLLIMFRFGLFAFMICYALTTFREDKGVMLRALRWATPWIIAQSVLTVLFRVMPDREPPFYRSTLGAIFTGPQGAALWQGVYNNVLDPDKAGGFFVNGNIASMFGGVAFFLFVLCRQLGGSKWNYLWALIALAGTVGTGSKTGISLAVALPMAYFLLPRLLRGGGRAWVLPAVLVGVPAASVLPVVIDALFPAFADSSSHAYASRDALWAGAAELFIYQPVFGLGFDGWAANIGAVTGIYTLPPHNLVIAAWANGGIVAAACVIVFMLAVVAGLLGRICRSETLAEGKVYSAALCVAAWVFIHGMGDNTVIYGHHTTMAFVALALGCLALQPTTKAEPRPTRLPEWASSPRARVHARSPVTVAFDVDGAPTPNVVRE